jgi:hypothetical protein
VHLRSTTGCSARHCSIKPRDWRSV